MSAPEIVTVARGDGPVILGVPHAGTWLPKDVADALNEAGLARVDTDWRVDALYDGLLDDGLRDDGLLGDATTVKAHVHRYAIDANRDPSGASLYPGKNTTSLCPTTDFDGRPIYKPGRSPDAAEIARRRDAYHRPYHAALEAEIARVKARHGVALLYDCHSIRSEIPFLFEGTLPVFSIGDNDGTTCDPAITQALAEICEAAPGYDSVVNGRFKGGWTTRRYGRPETGAHAIQMELAQRAYLEREAPPWTLSEEKSSALRAVLAEALARLDDLARGLARAT